MNSKHTYTQTDRQRDGPILMLYRWHANTSANTTISEACASTVILVQPFPMPSNAKGFHRKPNTAFHPWKFGFAIWFTVCSGVCKATEPNWNTDLTKQQLGSHWPRQAGCRFSLESAWYVCWCDSTCGNQEGIQLQGLDNNISLTCSLD